MKIISIGLGNLYNRKISNTNGLSLVKANPVVVKPYAPDSVSFGRVAENAEKMRRMFKYRMIDIHTGQEIIDPEWFKGALQDGLFNKSVSSVVKTLKPMKKCLHKVEAELFDKLEEVSKKQSLLRLDDVIQKMAPAAQARLLKIQRPIFDRLKQKSYKLPQEQRSAFNELMMTTESQLENKPILYKFSKKEFKYQLERIAQGIKRRGIESEIHATEKLIIMANKMPYIPSGRNFSRRKPKFDINKSIVQADTIRQMDNYLMRSVLKEDKELLDLFSKAKKQVFNIPTVIPFKRKTFIHELQSIVDTIPNNQLSRDIMKIASELPTAQEELSAFIMKSSRNSSTKIGHDLLYGSVGAIDHLEPYSHGGADTIENYAFTTNAMNSKRGDKVLSKWLKENPKTYEGAQKCYDRLVELYREGIFEKEDFTPWYMINFAKRMKKLSPAEKPISININDLFTDLTAKAI